MRIAFTGYSRRLIPLIVAYCWVIPAVNNVLIYKYETFALTCKAVIKIEPCKFYLYQAHF